MPGLTYYDPFQGGPVAPISKPGWNIGIYQQNAYEFYRTLYVEGIPPSRQMTQDLGTLAANSTGTETRITVADVAEGSLVQVRAQVLDDFEAQIAQPRANGLHVMENSWPRLSLTSPGHDPYYSLTTMFILGAERSIYVTPFNNSDYALAATRIRFWGIRYVIEKLPSSSQDALNKWVLEGDDKEAKALNLQAIVVGAAGRQA